MSGPNTCGKVSIAVVQFFEVFVKTPEELKTCRS